MSDIDVLREEPLGPASLVRYVLEAAAFFTFIGFFRLLGIDGASALGGFIGREIFYRLPITNRARTNLRAAFPQKSERDIEVIIRAMCDNLGRTVAEYAHLEKIKIFGAHPRLIEEVVPETGSATSIAEAARVGGNGIMFFSGHFANWEVMPFIAVELGYGGGEVYRPQNNPFVDRWLVKKRMINGPKDQIAKGPRGTRRIFSLLRQSKTVCLLVDQKTNEGVPSLYFGREAMTTPAPAALALRLGSALVPAQLERMKGAHFRFRIHPPIQFERSGDHERDILALTQRLTSKIEEMVRENPAQWLWIHRRWPTEREQDQVRGKRAIQGSDGGAGVRVEREGSSLT